MSKAHRFHRMWVQPDVFGLFSGSVGSFSDNVGLSAIIFSVNVGTKLRCFRAEPFIFSGRYSDGPSGLLLVLVVVILIVVLLRRRRI
jgi:hypothetical protein